MKKFILILILALCLTVYADVSTTDINHETVRPASQLASLLRDKIDDINLEIDQKTYNVGTGDIYYVDSAVGNDSYVGTKKEWATATLDAAIALCDDGNHDVIYVMSGHAETMSTITLDIDDITIIGIGSGVDMPEFTFDTTTDEVIIDAQGVTVYNLRFLAGVAEVANCFDLQDESDYASIIGCEFPEPVTATHEFDKVFQLVTGADNVTIAYNTFINQGATPGVTSFIDGGAAAIDSLTVIGNYINADCDVAALMFSDQADTNLLIANNTVIQEDVDKYCIQLTSTPTGLIKDNTFFNLGGSTYYMDPGTCHVEGNTGDPVMDAIGGHGNTWYVDDGGSNGDGLSWETAKTTLAAAEALCVAGDTILVGQLHNEALTTGGDTINIAGVTVRGKGEGNKRPLFDMDADSDELTLDAAGITLDNLRFRPGATALTSGIRVEDAGIGCVIKNCAFVDGEAAGTDEWTDCISVDTSASDLTVENCTYYCTGAPGTFVNLDEATIANPSVIGCTVYGTFSEGCIWGAAAIPTNVLLKDNILSNMSSGQLCIEFTGNATGICIGNRMYSDAYATILDPGYMKCIDNWAVDSIDENAIPIPTIARPYALLGTRVTRAAADIFDGTTTNLFTIAGGRVLITHLSMENSIAACDATANAVKLVMNPTNGTDTDLCTTLDVADDEQYTLYSITGEFGDALVQSGAANSGAVQSMQNPIICAPGTIDLNSAGDSGSGATDVQTSVELWYFPLDDGATVVGA